jgi:hypothetical protein
MAKKSKKHRGNPRIVAFGCSITAGAELLDHEIRSDAEEIKRQQGLHYWNKYHRHPDDDHAQLLQRELQLAWPAQVAANLGWSLQNRAVGGSSLSHCVRLLEQDMYHGEIRPQDMILVGVPLYSRMFTWEDPDRAGSWQIHNPHTWPSAQWDQKTLLTLLTDWQLLWQHLTALLRLTQISDQLQGRVRLFDVTGQNMDPLHALPLDHHFWHQWQEITASGHCLFDRSLASFQLDHEQHAGQHPHLVVHQRFAQWVVAQLAV